MRKSWTENQLSNNQLEHAAQASAIKVAMEGVVQCANKAQRDPMNHPRITTEVAASERSILEASLKHGSRTGLGHDAFCREHFAWHVPQHRDVV